MPRILALSLASLLALSVFTACDEPPAPAAGSAADLAALEGGEALPAGALKVTFPWMGKQSVMCIGDSIERQIAFLDFGTEQNDANDSAFLGTVLIDDQGVGTGSFRIAAAQLRSGHHDRDTKLLGGAWLDAESHPHLGLEIRRMTRVRPTVWKVEGVWTMRGISKEVTFHVNARAVGEMKWVGDNVARITGRFDINLKHFGMDNGSVGTAAVAEVWTVDVALLGVIST
jgi:polyisoprenoid-binding protein YceI